jgi:hypothetical protein
MILRSSWLLATLVPCVFADVKFISPAAGATVTAPTISIEWEDSGNPPQIADLASYQLFLCAGGNEQSSFVYCPPIQTLPITDGRQVQLIPLVTTGSFATGNSVTLTIALNLGANVENAYFLQMVSAATAGGDVTNYSDRFTISGMDGVFSEAVTAGLQTVSGTAGPPTENNVQAVQQPAAGADGTAAIAAGGYTVAYTLQTGPVRYAPMPPLAVTKISAKGQSRQWPTSAYTVYPAPAGSPNAITTNTMPQTFSSSSIENTVGVNELA